MGDAVATTLLLRDWDNYGLSERVCYHFDLTEALGTTFSGPPKSSTPSNKNDADGEDEARKFERVCGVVSILECVPFTPLNRLTKRQRRALLNEIRDFNLGCMRARDEKRIFCHEPARLPLRLNPASRLFFAYEVTRMVFCVDASPTLTSTFGGTDADGYCCPMDRISPMAKTFFKALVEPIAAPTVPIQGVWRPEIDVTVIAVYPRGTGLPQTGLLVRDFQVHDTESAELLAKKIEEWCLGEVESEIARRLATGNPAAPTSLLSGYDSWSIPLHSSSLRDILDAGDVSLSILSSVARPCIVVATDGRSVSCDGVMDILADADRSDVPLVVLDVSSPQSHSQHSDESGGGAKFNEPSLMQHDPGGPSTFPLHLSDDTEALHGICRATGGCFFDEELLQQAAQARAGQVEDSPFSADHYFSFRRRSVKPNAVQWYILFSLSPLSPTFNSAWGKIVPPQYLRRRPLLSAKVDMPQRENSIERRPTGWTSRIAADNSTLQYRDLGNERKPIARTTFSTYIISPIPIKGLLMMRVKEGYRAKQYGQSTQDTDKVLIQFNLPLELGTVLHYELSYKALANQSHMVGVAHIKIELSGEPGFIQSVKNDFLRQTHVGRPITMAQQVSARLCKILRWIRKEDCLQSYLCPLRWSDQLVSPDTPFVRRLRTLTGLQRRRHFRFDQFDVVCTGRMPYAHDDGFFSVFDDSDDGEQELTDAVAEWSTQVIETGRRYIKQTKSSESTLATYCVIELSRAPVAARVFTVAIEFFGGTGACDRLEILSSLKRELSKLNNVEVLSKQMGDYVVCLRKHQSDPHLFWKQGLLENQHHHASWDLVKDPELLPLLMKRRTEIGLFKLLDSSDDHALFGKLIPSARSIAEDLIQYQIAILSDRVVIDLHMESSCGEFFPFRTVNDQDEKESIPQFHRMAYNLKRRDQECGRALRCRTGLLMALDDSSQSDFPFGETQLSCVQRLLPYASKVSRKLRFFHPGCGDANDILQGLSEELLLSDSFGIRAARLSIDRDEDIAGIGRGSWFIVKFDHHTMSIVHHSLVDRHGGENDGTDSFTYRELTFFTVGVSDLYSTRDDVADDDSADSHISEYLPMVEFADLLGVAHMKNFSSAAYLALKDGSFPVESIQHDDLEEAVRVCEFVEVASVIVAGIAIQAEQGDMKLRELVATVLGQVSVCDHSEHCLFYYARGNQEELMYKYDADSDSLSAFDDIDAVAKAEAEEDDNDEDKMSASADDFSAAIDLGSRSEDGFDKTLAPGVEGLDRGLIVDNDESARNLDDQLTAAPSNNFKRNSLLLPPLFVRFTLNGNVASMADLTSIRQSSALAAHVSVFKRKSKSSSRIVGQPAQLPESHSRAALELSALLSAYVAEQTLERLRQFGPKLNEDDLRVVRRCLRSARNVIKSKIEVYFYSGKTDTMVPAFAPAGRENAVKQGFALLMEEIQKNVTLPLRAYSGDVFLAMESEEGSEGLKFWCFITVQRTHLSLKVHHPQGAERAVLVTSTVQEMILKCCHRVNQQLLLRRLHESRTASELLIPKDMLVVDEPETEPDTESEPVNLFRPGVFACPVVFRTAFELFHRCATNPGQVARKLEASVLHSFAVSNRRNVFVYKDETGDVFYMMLAAQGGGVEPDGTVELQVFGVQEPGPSITSQLTQLLQRRLLLIAVDMLSSVLTKNPHFHWKRADLDFIRFYEEEWTKLDENHDIESTQRDVEYEFPPGAVDPGMILLYFRQNLCGSTFFHRLNVFTKQTVDDKDETGTDDEEIDFNVHDFIFYYNNNPSKLDPKFQSISTLTDKGATYCRQAGTGIAIVQMSLLHSSGDAVKKIRFGVATDVAASETDILPESLTMRRAGSEYMRGTMRVKVSITGTALNQAALHNWVSLTLNQVCASWFVEKHIERMQRKLLVVNPVTPVSENSRYMSDTDKKAHVDNICPGLPGLTSIFEKSVDLPHPAFTKTVGDGVVRASSIATVTLELLDSIVTLSNAENKKTTGAAQLNFSDIWIIRLSRSETPKCVRLDYDANKRSTIVHILGGDQGEVLCDKPIDCPEYICFYCDPQYAEMNHEGTKFFPMLFREVVVDDGNSDKSTSIGKLERLKKRCPSLFFQSFSFVFSVKRNCRTLLTYNWTPQVVKSVGTRLLEKDHAILAGARQSLDALQLRTLTLLSPPNEDGTRKKAATEIEATMSQEDRAVEKSTSKTHEAKTSDPSDEKAENTDSNDPGLRRRASRPIFIRRPKLVGKSVEGAAIHAVAASRARASNKQRFTRGNPSASTVQSQKSNQEDITEEKPQDSASPSDDRKKITSSKAIKKPGSRVSTDESLVAAKARYKALSAANSLSMKLRSSQSFDALQRLVGMWWPSTGKTAIPRSVADYILSKSPRVWSDVREVPPIPTNLLNSFARSLARTITMWAPAIILLPVPARDLANADSVLLIGEVKNVRGCKCVAVFKLSNPHFGAKGRQKNTVKSEGWVVTLPRYYLGERRSSKTKSPRQMSLSVSEKDSAALDKLSVDLHSALNLDCLVFDFLGFTMERVMKSLDNRLRHDEIIPIVRGMLTRYPLHRQRTMSRLNYRAFQANVVLSSYENRLINFFTAPALYEWLYSHVEDRNLIKCGTDGLFFKKEVIVENGVNAIAFLTSDRSEPTKLELLVLCRTQGKDLHSFMFREGSDVAISVLDNIAGEVAGLAYEELRTAAKDLRCTALWTKVSRMVKKRTDRPTTDEIDELLFLVTRKPLFQKVGPLDASKVAMVMRSDINWLSCCAAMQNEPCFSPSHVFQSGGLSFYLFYLRDEDFFLLFQVENTQALLHGLDIVMRNEKAFCDEMAGKVIQKLVNYILFYLWFGI